MKFIKKFKIPQHMTMILIFVTVTFPVWAFGGTGMWSIYILFFLSMITFVSSVVVPIASCDFANNSRGSHFIISSFLFFLLICNQILNPSHNYSFLNQGLTAQPHIIWLPASVSRVLTLHALLLLISYLFIYRTVCCILTLRYINTLIGVIIAGAVCMSILALLQGSEHECGDLVGMFLNDNNFAAYINLILPVVLGSARTIHKRAKEIHSRSNPSAFIYFCAGILAAAVLFTGSRAGAVITMLIFVIWVLMEFFDAFRLKVKTRQVFVYTVLALLPLVLLLYLSGIGGWYQQLANPVTGLGDVIATRRMVITDAWRMFLDRIFYGVGAGAFHAAFPYYQNAAVSGFYRNAHNDWIQWLSELGVVGCFLGAVAIVTAFRRCVAKKSKASLPRYIERGIWIGLASVCLHSMLDFPFRIPAISVIVAVWIGLLTKRRCRSKK